MDSKLQDTQNQTFETTPLQLRHPLNPTRTIELSARAVRSKLSLLLHPLHTTSVPTRTDHSLCNLKRSKVGFAPRRQVEVRGGGREATHLSSCICRRNSWSVRFLPPQKAVDGWADGRTSHLPASAVGGGPDESG